MKNLVGIILCLPAFVGCSSTNDGLEPTAKEVTVNSFAIVGTSDPSTPVRPQPINSGVNDGNFSMSWDIQADGLVRVRIGVSSAGSQVCNAFNVVFNSHCGEDGSCELVDTVQCNFSSNNILSCERGETLDLSEFFDTLPKDADICLGARGVDSVADSGEVRVQFQ